MTKRLFWLATLIMAGVLLPAVAAAQVELVVWHAYRGKEKDAFDVVLANPPFKGALDEDTINPPILRLVPPAYREPRRAIRATWFARLSDLLGIEPGEGAVVARTSLVLEVGQVNT